MPATESKNAKASRNFKVVRGLVGPYPAGHVFSEDDFKERHGLTGSAPEKAQVNPDTYHDALLSRLLSLGVIEPATPSEVPQAVPVGPENMGTLPGNAAINRAASESVKAKAEQDAISAANAPKNDLPPLIPQPAKK